MTERNAGVKMHRCRRRACSGFDAVFHAVAPPLDYDGFGMMQDAIQDCGGQGAVVVEDRRPVLEDIVGGQDDGAAFVSLADDLEEKIGAVLVDGQIPEFIH